MFKITGLNALQSELEQASRAIEQIDGDLGTVSFDPGDPASIDAALNEINRLIDEKLGCYAGNGIVGPLIDQLKEQYREGILEKAAAARLEGSQD